MLILYKATGHSRDVPDTIGSTLVARGIATDVTPKTPRPLLQSRQMAVERSPDPEPEISARTGLPKRKYKRRDMRAED